MDGRREALWFKRAGSWGYLINWESGNIYGHRLMIKGPSGVLAWCIWDLGYSGFTTYGDVTSSGYYLAFFQFVYCDV